MAFDKKQSKSPFVLCSNTERADGGSGDQQCGVQSPHQNMLPPWQRHSLQLQAVLLFAAGFVEGKKGEGRKKSSL
jgi:hypothetical protein